MTAFDVAVAGGGPSGAWAAFLLAQQGARVVVIDGSHPREKPCGGGVSGRALRLVAPAVPALLRLGVRIQSATFVDTGSARRCTVSLGDESHDSGLVVASRRDMDAHLLALAREAGAELVTSRVTGLERTSGGYSIRMATGPPLMARAVIGADGVTSVVRRRLSVPFRRDQLSIAAGFFVHGPADTNLVIEFAADPPGYFWSFPRLDHLAVGVCAQADAGASSTELKARTAEWLRATGIGSGRRWQPYAWPIPSLTASDLSTLTVSGDDWCLIGDAAGLVDPITREGIYFALRSASLAAQALGSGSLGRYASRVRSEIISELVRAARLKAGFFKPHFTRLVMEAIRESAPIRRVMADLIAGEQPYDGLAWQLIRTRELGLAWRLATTTARERRGVRAGVRKA